MKSLAPQSSRLVVLGLRLSAAFERWFPDAFALALLAAVGIYAVSALLSGAPIQTARWFGAGYWDLVAFTLQMAMVIVTGYALASAPPVFAVVRYIARAPTSPRGAVAFVALFSMLSSLLSWSFSLVFSGLLAREVARRVEGTDYRAIGAAAYLGVGSVWALGLSSSAALLMATPASLPKALLDISGPIPLTQTLGLWQSGVVALCLIGVSLFIAYASAPLGPDAKTMADMGVAPEPPARRETKGERPGEWLEYSPVLTIVLSLIAGIYLAGEVRTGGPLALLNLNNYIFTFAAAALLLHWRPRSFVAAINQAVPSVGGVLIQYPIYAGIIRMMTESGLAQRMAHGFIEVSTANTFPLLVGIYSAVLGLFIPSAGGKWLIEAPYLLSAAQSLHVHLGWVVQTYNATEALANLVHPFWMLPLLGILGLKPRDVIGYSVLQFIVHVPLVLLLVWALNFTLAAGAPHMPGLP